MKRSVYTADHDDLRESFGRFLDAEVVPHYDTWEREGRVPREVLRRVGELGFYGLAVPEEFGGAGADDFRFNSVLNEEATVRGLNAFSLCITMQNDVALPYVLELCSPEQQARWLPGIVSGDLVLGIAMTEPGTGSDLAGMTTKARIDPDDPDHYVVDGSKTFITSGLNADLVITAVRTGTTGTHADISLLMVETGATPGFSRGRNLEKLGQHAQDTAELFFDGARVPRENLIGAEGDGFRHLTHNLPQERLSIAVGAVGAAQGALDRTLEYVQDRTAFGRPVGTFQNSRFTLAHCRTDLDVTRAFVDRCLEAHVAGELTAVEAAQAKYWASEMLGRVTDECLQLHGGYGYMTEYPICRDYADARILRIYGGTTEIMKEIIGRAMGLGDPRP
ncbi:acyl-CoA dehydrogenase [Conexibacter sp. W3-3-2]|uniref:Acyl-[acyl-carrier-protein] dehydrogenase MbtN n=1 Tax=Paraconexibacter algicola TaxID=2133960 RepID=A0A2T4UJV1_9ACTN|nr:MULTISPECIES: acyl-CoA dehydrogenase family protein [Solirubrobacterales]MTD45855.1 acyl-CoA dehydrogenase [Conexibacter sp. W3-3-2]PTL59509.1 acyl-CoA dehydrogenase [Paraconexibacter algicola]